MSRIAIVGAGNMAREHAKALLALEQMSIAGVLGRAASRTIDLAESIGTGVYGSLDELADDESVEGVIVAVSEEEAVGIVEALAANRDWPILCEKPLGLNSAETRRLVGLSGSMPGQIFLALNRRFLPSSLAALYALGQTQDTRFIHVTDQEAPSLSPTKSEIVRRNWAFANSIHLIDLGRMFARGSLKGVRHSAAGESRFDGFLGAVLEFDSGDLLIYDSIWERPGPWSVSVTTKKARWELRPLEDLTVQAWTATNRVPVKIEAEPHTLKPGLRGQALEFDQQIRLGSSQLPTLSDYFESTLLVEAIYGPWLPFR